MSLRFFYLHFGKLGHLKDKLRKETAQIILFYKSSSIIIIKNEDNYLKDLF